ncbi:MAG: glycosyltransferase family 4 protein [Lachnospiraceae bacterium]|nr:glycosyltransferase family 4 protein [Lachnospiraceae bacterium]
MIIAVNAVLAYEQPRGVGNYLNILLPALAEADKTNEYYIYYGRWMGDYVFTKIQQDNFHLVELDIRQDQISRNLFLAVRLPQIVKKLQADVYWVPDSQATLFKPCRMISTIHDLAEYVVPQKYSAKTAAIRRMYVKHQVKISDHIITVSEYSAKDMIARFGLSSDKVSVVYNALGHMDTDKPDRNEIDNCFLFVSEIERAKNLNVLIKAYALLDKEIKDKYELHVVGKKGNNYEEISRLISELGLESRVRFFGYLGKDELSEMYRRAFAFVFPSLFEGFGFPVLEAMSLGVPVICSDVSSIPEVGGDAVLMFAPNDEKQLAEHMKKLVSDKELYDKLSEAGYKRSRIFSIQKMAEETKDVLTQKKE